MVRRKKPDLPPNAAKPIREALDRISSPKVRKATTPKATVPRKADPNAPVPSHYRQVRYGSTPESRLAQQARLDNRSKGNLYGAATFKDDQGNSYAVTGFSNKTRHAEGHMMKQMREQIAARQGIPESQVDLTKTTNVKMFVEFSPCDTPPYRCQE